MTEPDDAEPAAADPTDLDLAGLFERLESTLLGGPRRYTRVELSQAAGIEADEARKVWRALGFATVGDDDVVFTDGDLTALRHARFLSEHLVIEDELRTAMTRMLGQTFSRLAAWQGQLLIELISNRPDLLASEAAITQFVDELLPVMQDIQTFVWRRQLAGYFSRVVSHATAEVAAAGIITTVVGFADMSGFTTLTRNATEAELRGVLEAFESATTDIVGAHDGRIVKTIGDEVLFVADSPDDGAQIALDLHEASAADDRLPALRVGLAAGPVVSRLGDVYGSTVNIASRLTSICRPGWVLVDRVMAESLRDDPRFVLRPRRPESVRGFHHLRQWRLRRAGTARPGARHDERRAPIRGRVGGIVERAGEQLHHRVT
ncbi:MAG: adenylate/guanylate cyclase domain-containing protein [Pseudonocardiales bacterium]|nr:MAG: adenylate/guanylate cyclase domain-containing protein [Pseudonocardiales bacterium]